MSLSLPSMQFIVSRARWLLHCFTALMPTLRKVLQPSIEKEEFLKTEGFANPHPIGALWPIWVRGSVSAVQAKSSWVTFDGLPRIGRRYYHLFERGELSGLLERVSPGCVLEEYHDQGNWCAVVGKDPSTSAPLGSRPSSLLFRASDAK